MDGPLSGPSEKWEDEDGKRNLRVKKRDPRHLLEEPLFEFDNEGLDRGHVCCGRPFGSLLDVKGDPIAFVERSEPGGVDRRMMNENIRPIFLLDKSKTLAVIEPLHNTTCHAAFS